MVLAGDLVPADTTLVTPAVVRPQDRLSACASNSPLWLSRSRIARSCDFLDVVSLLCDWRKIIFQLK